jgi:protein O-mannosyl-transferase
MSKPGFNRNPLPASPGRQPAPPPGPEVQKVIAICLGLFVLVVWAFWPSLSNGFVNLDDPLYVYENVHVQKGLAWESFRWAFTNLDAGFWHPLTWLTIALDCQLFGLRPAGHHFTSVLLHAASTVLLFLTFRLMTRATYRSGFVAVLFALHPLHVESVAWAAERKDVLSTFFFMLTLWTYVRYAERPVVSSQGSVISGHVSRFTFHVAPYYLLSLSFFVCGLMSKTMVVTLPLVLLLLDWWPLRRFQASALRRLVLEKLPFLAAGALAGVVSIYSVKQLAALPDVAQFPVADRAANAIQSCARYLAQTLWPVDLAVYYPYPATFPLWPVLGVALVLLTATGILFCAAHQRPYLAVGWLWYAVTLLPVIGLVQVGGHSRADRYTYVPLIGLFLLLAWGAHDLTKRWRHHVICLCVAGIMVASLCFGLVRKQLSCWKDSESLLGHAIAVTKDNAMAQNNLGAELTRQGRLDEAIGCLQEAVRIAPGYAEAHNNLGTALAMQGRLDEAIACFQESLRLKPNHAQAHNDLGAALGRQGRLDEALGQLQEAVRLAPDLADARCNLGDALAAKGRLDEAIAQYQQAIQLNPNYSDTHNHLGLALSSKGRLDEAIGQFQQALKLNPDYAQAHGNLGAALGRMGRLDEAIYHLQEAVRLKPDYAAAQQNLRAVLAAKAVSPNQSGPAPR